MKWLPEKMRQALGASSEPSAAAGAQAHAPAETASPPSYRFEDLAIGMSAAYARKVDDDAVAAFATISGDTNPVHLDPDFAAGTRFKKPIAHGLLTASYISTVLGTKLPGAGAIYLSQTLHFRAPVYHGDTVKARVEITELVPWKDRAILKCTCTVEDRVVLEGEAVLLVPRRETTE